MNMISLRAASVCVALGLAGVAVSPVAGAADRMPTAPFDVARLQAGAAAGDAVAQFKLGTLYWAGIGVVQDYLAAARTLRAAADQGNAEAQCELGLLFQSSTYADNAPQDLTRALQWYSRAAGQGNACGEFALAAMYRSGHGGEARDADKAAALFAKAAAQGYAAGPAAVPLQRVFAHFREVATSIAGAAD